MLKKAMMAAALALLFAGALAQKRQVMLDKVVAVVGGSSILYSEVDDYARQLTEQRRQEGYTSDRDPMNEALEALMTQKLLYNQAQIDSVKVNDADIMARVEEQVQQMVEAEGSIPQLEAKHHMPIFNIREIMRQRYEEQAYANSMQTEVVDKVSVIPGEVERFYKSISKYSLPLVSDQYVYAQITKFPKSMTAAKQRTRERLIDMRERVITGKAKFENLARMYSQDPGTMMRGGEMDPSTLEQLDPAFGAALEKMRPGQISEVVESQFGFHIIQLLDKRGRLYHFRHILLRPVYTTEELGGSLNTLDSLVKVIRKDSITFERAALLYSDDAQSKMNGGIVSNHDILERFNAFMIFDFVGLEYSLYRIQQLLFIIISRSAIHRRFCADRKSCLNVDNILLQRDRNTVYRFSLILCFDFIGLTSLFIKNFFRFLFKNFSIRVLLFVNHDFMAFGIPVVPKFTTVWKFGFSTFLQVVYLLPDVRQC